jgi:putative aldouronate transport system substrate-binding protein
MADPERKVFYALEKPEFVQWSKQMREWAQKGYWSKNALSNRTPVKDSFKAGTSASAIVNFTNANDVYLELSKTHPEWDVKVFNALNANKTSIGSYMVNGMALSANSKKPERALMLLDLLKNNEEYYMLTNYGIKDTHYKITDEGKVDVIAADKFSLTNFAPWGWNNGKLDKVNAVSLPNYAEILNYYNDNYVEDPLREFKLDISNITEIDATIRDVNKQYGAARTLGMIEDVDKSIQDSIKKAKDAGLDKYLAEVQNQITDYLAKYNEMVK